MFLVGSLVAFNLQGLIIVVQQGTVDDYVLEYCPRRRDFGRLKKQAFRKGSSPLGAEARLRRQGVSENECCCGV